MCIRDRPLNIVKKALTRCMFMGIETRCPRKPTAVFKTHCNKDVLVKANQVCINYARSDRSERSAQLLAFKHENFVYSRTKNSHFSMCPFRGCGFTYGKNTSLLHVSIFSRSEIVEIIGPNTWEIISSASFA